MNEIERTSTRQRAKKLEADLREQLSGAEGEKIEKATQNEELNRRLLERAKEQEEANTLIENRSRFTL